MKNYVIQPGDTYISIGKKFNVSIQDLKNLNKFEDKKLPIGQNILIPESNQSIPPSTISKSDTPADSLAKENVIPNNPGLKNTVNAALQPLLTEKETKSMKPIPNINPTNNVIVEAGLNMVKEQEKKVVDTPKKFNLAAVLNTVASNLEILRSYDYPRLKDERKKIELISDIHKLWSNKGNIKDKEIIKEAIDKRKEAVGIKTVNKENGDKIIQLDLKTLYLCMPEGDYGKLMRYLAPLNSTFVKFEIKDEQRLSHFLAQIGHESTSLKAFSENPSSFLSSHDKYKGRGPIQLTLKENYQKFGDYIGINLIKNPDLVATDLEIAFNSVGWFWKYYEGYNFNTYADKNDFLYITYRVNGGFIGLDDRLLRINLINKILKNNQNTNYQFEESKCYFIGHACFKFAEVHDPNTKNFQVVKNKQKAITYYKRALELNLSNEKIKICKQQLKKLE